MSQKRYKQQRQAATPKGFCRRIRDAKFEAVDDSRHQAWVQHPLVGLLWLAVMALVSKARSTREVEDRSEGLKPNVRQCIDLAGRVADNTFGLVLRQIDWCQMREALHRYIKAEWGRGNLRPERLPQSTVAIDGKHVATIREKTLRRLITANTPLDGDKLDFDELSRIYSTRFRYVQIRQTDEGRIHGLIRVHRATLVSSNAAVVLDQWPIRGNKGEWSTIEVTLSALWSAYSRTDIIEMVTLDAGNASPEAASWLRDPSRQVDYFMAVKKPQGELKSIARDELGDRPIRTADYRTTVRERGKMIEYTVWCHPLENDYGYQGASQVFRIQRTVRGDGESTSGTRYFVTSSGPDKLAGEDAKQLAQAHWRCENEGHWTADAIFDEDARRTPWTKHPEGVIVVGLLRAIAINILAVLRAASRLQRGDKLVTPAWQVVINHAFQVLFDPFLDTGNFNTFE